MNHYMLCVCHITLTQNVVFACLLLGRVTKTDRLLVRKETVTRYRIGIWEPNQGFATFPLLSPGLL